MDAKAEKVPQKSGIGVEDSMQNSKGDDRPESPAAENAFARAGDAPGDPATGESDRGASDINPRKPLKRRRKLSAIGGFFLLLLFAAVAVACLPVVLQNRMIYFPRQYPATLQPGQGQARNFQSFTVDGVDRWGLFVRPSSDIAQPATNPDLWLVFYGNASLAGEMAPIFQLIADRTGARFFIVDYPGYGFNEGRPTEKGMTETAVAAYDTLQAAGLAEDGIGVVGHSMGAAVAFALAEQRPVEKIVAVSAFPSVKRVARDLVPWPYPLFLWNHWPNAERLRELLDRPDDQTPQIILMHGGQDRVIGVQYGRELAAVGGDRVTYLEYPQADHNDVFDFIFEDLVRVVKGEQLEKNARTRAEG